MSARSEFWFGGAGGVLLTTCWGIALLAGVAGTPGIATLAAWSTRTLLPAIGLAAVARALVIYLRSPRGCAPSARDGNRSGLPAGSL